jgi:hypothetical protein
MLLVPAAAVIVLRSSWRGRPQAAAPPSVAARPPLEPAGQAQDGRTAEVHGRVLDADGNAVDGAAVRIVSAGSPPRVMRDKRSDRAGRFSFERVEPATVRVVADHDPDGSVTSAELHVTAGRSIEITLVLAAGGAILGTVVDTEDHPVSGATLSVEGVPWLARSATSDAAGTFRLAAIPREATFLVAVASGYRAARVSLSGRTDQADVVVRVRLAGAPPIDGDVRDVDGKPVRARVVACEGQPAEARTTSGEDGTFQLPPATVGCGVVAQHDEYAPSDAVTALEGTRLALRLKPGGAIEGVVVDERGTAISSFTVGIESFAATHTRSPGSGGPRTFEDPRGAFHWERLAPGAYVLTAAAAGKPPTRSDPIDLVGGATTRVRIVLPEGGSVIGHVYDERRAPVGGVDLRFDAVSSIVESKAAAKTDDSGRYRLDGAPTGPFTLRVQKDGFRIRMLSGLHVDPHGTLTRDITLTSIDGGPGLELGGIGANLVQAPEGISIGGVFPGDPAERAGLRAGDHVVRVDGEDTEHMSVADVLQRLRGEEGTTVGVSVQRKTGDTVDVLITRAAIVH